MGITIMVGVEEEGAYRVLDFMLPSWMVSQVVHFAGDYVDDEAVLAPFVAIDWSAYNENETPRPYAMLLPARVTAAVDALVRVLEEYGTLFAPSHDQWSHEDVLMWLRRLRKELDAAKPGARVRVGAA